MQVIVSLEKKKKYYLTEFKLKCGNLAEKKKREICVGDSSTDMGCNSHPQLHSIELKLLDFFIMLHGYYYFSLGVSLFKVPQSFSNLA